MITLEYQADTNALVALEWGLTGLRVAAERVLLISQPPAGKCRIVNVYWDPELQRAVFEYDDTPEK